MVGKRSPGWASAFALAVVVVGGTFYTITTAVVAGASAREPVSYFFTRPCELVPKAEVEKVLNAPMGNAQAKPAQKGASCTYITTGSDMYAEFSYAFDTGTAASVRSHYTGARTPEPAAGHSAYCVVAMANEAAFESNLASVKGTAYHLNISAQTCAFATKLAEYAYGRLS